MSNLVIYAPVKGTCEDIENVSDITFAQKMIGDGIAIIPSDSTVSAPCDGTICMLFPTGHAFGIQTEDGSEVLVHIGIDTANSNGDGFKVHAHKGDKVVHGQKIISFDYGKMLLKNYDMTTMVILTKGNQILKRNEGDVNENDVILEAAPYEDSKTD